MIERYETPEMKHIFSDEARFLRFTHIEKYCSQAFYERGEIPENEFKAIEQHCQTAPSPARILELEAQTHHDVVAFVRALGEQVGEPAKRHLHRGLTSSDVVDTALAMSLQEALSVLEQNMLQLADIIKRQAHTHQYTPCVGRTHGIHAEPTTFGLRLAGFYTELQRNLQRIREAKENISYAKLSGAVGTFSQTDPAFEAYVLKHLNLKPEPIATQVVPRDRHAQVFTTLAIMAGSFERMAVEIRSLQRTDVREAEEPFKAGQTGSSAMPHKRNPILTERICGMSRLMRSYAQAALENIALWHDRDISHSSVERVIAPDAFHVAHTMLLLLIRVFSELRVYPENMMQNLNKTRGLIFSQTVLGFLLEQGADRTESYAAVQHAAMRVWEESTLDFKTALLQDSRITKHVSESELSKAFELERFTKHINTLFQRAGL